MPGNIIMVILKLSYQGNFAVFCNAYFLDGLHDHIEIGVVLDIYREGTSFG